MCFLEKSVKAFFHIVLCLDWFHDVSFPSMNFLFKEIPSNYVKGVIASRKASEEKTNSGANSSI